MTTAAIAAARKTDGDGRTKPINAINAAEVTNSRRRTRLIGYCISQSRNELMIAKLAPETAVKCVKPDLRIALENSTLCSEVSPNTIPGISGSLFDALRKPALIWPNLRCQILASAINLNLSHEINSAATRGSLLSNSFPVA